eukprot:CAMPEP_0113462436 /NCGR_PEP_ID=MMETSP0014_2-20120614/12093_1 /TAXON_ID=2857 /ORGANISM="Nitzschia sp." /LENGTH=385 /DNA_ID=CAMNT_0000354303 /DNA_START=291 /DNA_END=1448 /DNA_ORIENTATION=- /assembly_acc=CAM_ASM_000159
MKPAVWSLLLLGGAAASTAVNAKSLSDPDSAAAKKAAVAEIKQRHEERFYSDLLDLSSPSSSKTLSSSSTGQPQRNQRKTRGGSSTRALVEDGKGKGKGKMTLPLPPMDCDINIEVFQCTATVGTMTLDCFNNQTIGSLNIIELEVDETMCENVTIQFGYVVTNDQSVAPSLSVAPSTEPSASIAPSSMSKKNGGKGKSDGSGKSKSNAPSQSDAPSQSFAPSPGPSASLAPSMSGKNGGKGKSDGNGKGKSGSDAVTSGLELLAIQEQFESFMDVESRGFASCGGEVKQVEIPDDWIIPPGDFALVSGSSITFNACECQNLVLSVGAVGGTATGSSSSGKGKGGSTEALDGTCSDVTTISGIVDVITSSSPSLEPSESPSRQPL